MAITTSVKNYFQDMGFYHDQQVLGRSILKKKTKWTIIVYFLVSLGIFSRKISSFPKVDLNMVNLRWPVLIASLIIGFAILPYVMQKISKKQPKPSTEHTLGAFGIGFFIDLASSQIVKFFN